MEARETLERLLDGERLSRASAARFLDAVLEGGTPAEVIASALSVMRHRGETTEEALGFHDAMMGRAIRLPSNRSVLIDTCGTGGDRLGTFNVSTATAITVAACGVAVAKHGNRSVSSRSGSTDVLESAGVPMVGVPVERLAEALDTLGLALLHAPSHHPALAVLAPVRRALGVRTLLNLMGPVINPAPLTHQMVGVPGRSFQATLAPVLAEKGLRASILHSSTGADEALPGAPFHVKHVMADGSVVDEEVDPSLLGVASFPVTAFAGGEPAENAQMLWDVLRGEGAVAITEAVVLNAGLALALTDAAPDRIAGIREARAVLASGEPARLLTRYIALLQGATA
jgi:anthranilate phosphoribosyltransferase